MYQNRATINATATANGGSAFATNVYWSSTGYSSGPTISSPVPRTATVRTVHTGFWQSELFNYLSI